MPGLMRGGWKRSGRSRVRRACNGVPGQRPTTAATAPVFYSTPLPLYPLFISVVDKPLALCYASSSYALYK